MTPPRTPVSRLSTEQRHPRSMSLGNMSASDVIQLMESEEHVVLEALARAHDKLVAAAEAVAASYLNGGRIVFLGAGTPGLLAVQEVAELPATFGVQAEQFVALVASKALVGPAAIATTEDATDEVSMELHAMLIGEGDVVIGVASSGRTPFVLAGIKLGTESGAWTCGIANSPDSPLLSAGKLGILLDTGPEVLTGSTRLKAGTAQKIALNRITTAAMVVAGRVRSNYMTEMRATNEKLRDRAVRIITELTGLTEGRAESLLRDSDWHVGEALRKFNRDC